MALCSIPNDKTLTHSSFAPRNSSSTGLADCGGDLTISPPFFRDIVDGTKIKNKKFNPFCKGPLSQPDA